MAQNAFLFIKENRAEARGETYLNSRFIHAQKLGTALAIYWCGPFRLSTAQADCNRSRANAYTQTHIYCRGARLYTKRWGMFLYLMPLDCETSEMGWGRDYAWARNASSALGIYEAWNYSLGLKKCRAKKRCGSFDKVSDVCGLDRALVYYRCIGELLLRVLK